MSALHAASCDCGWTGTYRTQAKADNALRRHSCDRQRTLVERAARVAARKAASGPVRDCQCPTARHQHGTHVAYVVDHCHCRACRDASAAYERSRTRRQAYGIAAYVDAEPARTHVASLRASGMGWKRVALAAGLSESVVWKLIYGDPTRGMPPSKRIRPATEQAILAAVLDVAPGRYIDGTGTARRVQALVAIGWSMSKIADRAGFTRANFTPVAHGRGLVTAATATKIAALYDDLWSTAPPRATQYDRIAYSRSVNYARAHGWAAPMAWDEDAIDDPTARPDLGEPVRVNTGGRPRADHVENVEWLLEHDPLATAEHLANRLHVGRNAIQQACRRAGRTDLVDRLARNARLEREGAA